MSRAASPQGATDPDFERWIREVLHDQELARRLHKLSRRPLEGEELREALFATVASRYEELESLI